MNAAIVTHTQARERTSRQPVAQLRQQRAPAPRRQPLARARTRSSSSRAHDERRCVERERLPAPTPSTTTVASAGPTMNATFDVDSVSARASWIVVLGDRLRDQAAVGGLEERLRGAEQRLDRDHLPDRRPRRSGSAPRASPCSTARTRSVAIMIRWRGSRSAHTPPNSSSATSGSDCAASTMPSRVGEPRATA